MLKANGSFKVIVQSHGHPLELAMLQACPELKDVVFAVENDYPLSLAQKGVCLNVQSMQDATVNLASE